MRKDCKFICATILLNLAACSSGIRNTDTESIPVSHEQTDAVIPDHLLTETGIEPVTLGLSVSRIPDSVPGLYDKFERYEGKSETGFSFLKDSIETFHAEDTDYDNRLNVIILRGDTPLKATTEKGELAIGCPESVLLDMGAKKVDGFYQIGKFKITVQEGKTIEIFVELKP